MWRIYRVIKKWGKGRKMSKKLVPKKAKFLQHIATQKKYNVIKWVIVLEIQVLLDWSVWVRALGSLIWQIFDGDNLSSRQKRGNPPFITCCAPYHNNKHIIHLHDVPTFLIENISSPQQLKLIFFKLLHFRSYWHRKLYNNNYHSTINPTIKLDIIFNSFTTPTKVTFSCCLKKIFEHTLNDNKTSLCPILRSTLCRVG